MIRNKLFWEHDKQKKQIHVINGTGKMRQCDQFPIHSVHIVKVDQNGIRWKINGVNSIHPDIGSEIHSKNIIGNMCYNCGNTFTSEAEFVEDKCVRCHERKNVLNRC